MRAGLRFGIAAFAAALAFGAAPSVAQNTAAPAANNAADPPATETIGPRELENFSLNGTVTRPAPTAPARPAPAPVTAAPRTPAPTVTERAPGPDRTAQPPRGRPAPAQSVTESLPPADGVLSSPAPAPADSFTPEPGFDPAPIGASPAEDDGSSFVPWLLALLLLGAGAGYFAWRQRAPSYATVGGSAESLARAQPAPTPQPLQRAPPPRPAMPPAKPAGVVSTRLRPWLEIEFSPGRCVVENDKATIQFDVSVFNSGSAPARDVLIEASMFNAGPAQDQEIGAFFAHPVAKGDRIPAIPPLKRVALKSAVSLSRDQMRQFEVAGRRLFVPLVGFNALYRWSGGDGQTSASYLVGRDTKGDKMAPLRLDLGPRIFRDLGARQHNVGVRR